MRNRTPEKPFLRNELRQIEAAAGQDPNSIEELRTLVVAAAAFDCEPMNLQSFLIHQTISRATAEFILKIALKRKAWEKRKGWNLDLGGIQRSVDGVAGEVVAARFLGLKIDKQYYEHGDKWDLEDKETGDRIQVRYTTKATNQLFQNTPALYADIAILVRGAGLPMDEHDLGEHYNHAAKRTEQITLMPEAYIAGWITPEDWDEHAYDNPIHGHKGWCIKNEHLRDPSEYVTRSRIDLDDAFKKMRETLES